MWEIKAQGTAAPVAPGPVNRQRLMGSPQQEAFWRGLGGGDTNLLLEARAGTGKSASCREGIWRLREAAPRRCVYVAFNRAIADDFQGGLPPGARAATMHSMGFAALRRAIPGIGEPAKHKMYDIVDEMLPRRDQATRRDKGAIVRLAELCKGYLIDGTDPADLVRLAARHGIPLEPTCWPVLTLVPAVLKKCLDRPSLVCFSDMTWLPVMLGLAFDPVDVLFVDEAQDLDPCQHALVRRIAGDGRVVITGDPFQAIYSFRGADSESIDTLSRQLSEETERGLARFPLTVTRRCPRSHVALARQVVPDLEAMPDAPGGRIDERESLEAIARPGLMVLCRTNAPLIEACYRLAASGIPVAIQGRDLGDGLLRLVDSLDAPDVPRLLRSVEAYRAAETARLAEMEDATGEIEALTDRCRCLLVVSRGSATVDEVRSRVRSLFLDVSPANQGRYVLLSSVHRAKGREADHVAILCPELLPHPMAPDDPQERNLAYVAATRARKRLSFLGEIPPIFRGA